MNGETQRLIPLEKWAEQQYGEDAPSIYTLRRWARDGKIRPVPKKHGRTYFVQSDAAYFDHQGELRSIKTSSRHTLVERLRAEIRIKPGERISLERLQRRREAWLLPLDRLRGLPSVATPSLDGNRDIGVYFLWCGPRLVYVGQSTRVPWRVDAHRSAKRFDRATWLRLPVEALRNWERLHVHGYRPRLNLTRLG